jgi:hypothetical protein
MRNHSPFLLQTKKTKQYVKDYKKQKNKNKRNDND